MESSRKASIKNVVNKWGIQVAAEQFNAEQSCEVGILTHVNPYGRLSEVKEQIRSILKRFQVNQQVELNTKSISREFVPGMPMETTVVSVRCKTVLDPIIHNILSRADLSEIYSATRF